MKKNTKLYLIRFLILIFTLTSFVGIKNINGDSPVVKFSIKMNDSSEISIDDLISNFDNENYNFHFDIYIEVLDQDRYLSTFQMNLVVDKTMFYDDPETHTITPVSFQYNTGVPPKKDSYDDLSFSYVSTVIMGLNSTGNIILTKNTEYKIATLNLTPKFDDEYKPDYNENDYFELDFDFSEGVVGYAGKDNGPSAWNIDETKIETIPLKVGTAPDADPEPDATLSSVALSGSGLTTQTLTNLTEGSSNNNTFSNKIPYNSTFTLTPTVKEEGATYVIKDNGTNTDVSTNSPYTSSLGLTADKSFTITVTHVLDDQTDTKIYVVKVQVESATTGDSARLKTLTISNVDGFSFDPDVFSYSLKTTSYDTSEVIINATVDSGYYINTSGNTTFDTTVTPSTTGSTVTINVYGQDGNYKTYTITITKLQLETKVTNVKVGTSNATINYDTKTITYNFNNIANTPDDFDIVIKTSDYTKINFYLVINGTKSTLGSNSSNSYTYNNDDGIDYGETLTYTILVTSTKDSSLSDEYTLIITRDKSTNTNATLEVLLGSNTNKQYDLNSNNTDIIYNLGYTTDTTLSLRISAVGKTQKIYKSDGETVLTTNFIYQFNISDLVQSQSYIIEITAQDGETTSRYTITINKLSNDVDIKQFYINDGSNQEKVAELSDLTELISGSTYTYSITINYEIRSIIMYVKFDEKTTIEFNSSTNDGFTLINNYDGKGTYSFTNKTEDKTKTFTIKAVSEGLYERTYVFNITGKKASDDSSLEYLRVSDQSSNTENITGFTGQKGDYQFSYQIEGQDNPIIYLYAKTTDEHATITYTWNYSDEYGAKSGLGTNGLINISQNIKRNYKSLLTITVKAQDETDISTFTVNILSANSKVGTINNIILEGLVTLSNSSTYEFNASTTSYEFNINYLPLEKTKVIIDKADEYATVKYSQSLDDLNYWSLSNYGDNKNELTITFTSEDGKESKEYKYVVNRAAPRTNKDLQTLKIEGKKSGSDTYETIISLSGSQITQEYTKLFDDIYEQVLITWTIDSTNGSYLDSKDKTKITDSKSYSNMSGKEWVQSIIVYDEGGDQKEYKITLHQANNDFTFNNVSFNGTTITSNSFNQDNNYTITLDDLLYNQEKNNVIFTLSDNKASVIITSTTGTASVDASNSNKIIWNTEEEDNTLKFKIKAQSGNLSREYTLSVYRHPASKINELRKIIYSTNGTEFTEFDITQFIHELVLGSDDANQSVIIKVYVLTSDYSTITTSGYSIQNNGEKVTLDDGKEYYEYKKVYQFNTNGYEETIDVLSQKGETNSSHKVKIIFKNTNNTIENIEVLIDNISIGDISSISKTSSGVYDLGQVRYITEKITFRVTRQDPKASVYINSTKYTNEITSIDVSLDLITNENNYTIYLLSEKGDKGTEYKFTIKKLSAQSYNDLFNLEIYATSDSEYKNNFVKSFSNDTKLLDKITISDSITNVIVFAHVKKSDYSKIDGFDSEPFKTYTEDDVEYVVYKKTFTLTEVEQNLIVKVLAENGNENSFTIPIYRPSDKNTIENITITEIPDFEFDSDDEDKIFDLGEVPYIIDKINLTIYKDHEKSVVWFGTATKDSNTTTEFDYEKTLLEGDNSFTVKLVSQSGKEGTSYTFKIKRTAGKTDSNLYKLSLSNTNNSNIIDFSEDVTKYYYRLDRDTKNENLNLSYDNDYENTHSIVQVKFNGQVLTNNKISLNPGRNELLVIVLAEKAPSETTYTVIIYFANNDYSLTSMKIGDDDVTGISYSKTVTYDIENLTFEYELNDTYAHLYENGTLFENSILSLADGINTFKFKILSDYAKARLDAGITKGNEVVVGSETYESQQYTISITRNSAYTDNTLASLQVLDDKNNILTLSPSFSSTITTYTLNLTDGITSITLKPAKKDDRQILTYESNSITITYNADGTYTNTLLITVTPEKGEDKIYTVNVTKNIELNNNPNISNIKIYSFDDDQTDLLIKNNLTFNKTTYLYEFSVAYNTSKIMFEISLENEKTIIYLNSSEYKNKFVNLTADETNPNVFTIKTVAEDGTSSSDYNFKITRNNADQDVSLKNIILKDTKNKTITPIVVLDLTKDVIDIYLGEFATQGINIELVPNYPNAQIPINKQTEIITSGEENVFTYYIISEDGEVTNTVILNFITGLDDSSIDSFVVNYGDNQSLSSTKFTYDENTSTYTYNDFDYKIKNATISFTASKNSSLYNQIKDIELTSQSNTFTFENESENKRNKTTIKIVINKKDPDTDSKLKELSVTGWSFDEGEFNKDSTNRTYTVKLPTNLEEELTSIIIKAVPNSEFAIVKDFNNSSTKEFELTKTENGLIISQFLITVIAEDDSTTVYTINVIQANTEEKSDDTSLDPNANLGNDEEGNPIELIKKPEDEQTNPDAILLEDIEVSYDTTYIDLTNICNDDNAKISPSVVDLQEGDNTVKFTVTAENGTTQDYIVKVIRESAESDNTLKTLKINYDMGTKNISIIENGIDTNNYDYTIDKTISAITLEVETNSSKAKAYYKTGAITLNEGLNVIIVTVIAQNGDSKDYTLKITRANTDPKLNSIDITLITVDQVEEKQTVTPTTDENGNIIYDLGEVLYKYNQINIEPIEIANSNVIISGNYGIYKLIVDEVNKFTITSTAEDNKSTIEYIIKVKRLNGLDENELSKLEVRKENSNGAVLDLLDQQDVKISFDSKTKNYFIKLSEEDANNLSGVYVYAETTGSGIIEGHNQTYSLERSGNVIFTVITINVTSEIGNINTYTVTILAGSAEEGSSNVKLKPNNPIYESEDGEEVLLEQEDPDQQPDPDETIVLKAIELPYEVTFLNLTDITSDPNAKVTPSIINLNQGKQTVEFTVIAENGTTQKYSIDVTRLNAESINDLIELSIAYNGLTKTLINSNSSKPKKANGSKEEFIEYLGRGITEIIVTAKPKSSKATLGDIEFLTGKTISMDEDGLTDILITVVAQDSSTKNYLLTISTLDKENELEFKFTDKNNNELSQTKTKVDDNNYTISLKDLAYSNDYINLAITPKNEYVKYNESLEGKNYLEAGIENTIIIVSTSENGQNTIKYTIKIKRLAGDDTSLKDELKFTTNNDTYEVVEDTTDTSVIGKVDIPYNEPQLDLRQLLNSDKASVEPIFIDLTTLTPGINKITFTVTGEDKTTTETYNININREDPSSDRTLKDLIITYNTSQQVKLIDNNVYNQDTRLSDTEFKVSLPKWSVSSFVIKLLVTPNDSNTKYYIEEQYNLNVGFNTIRFTVVSEDEEHLDYIININVGNSEIYIDTLKVVDTSDETIIYSLTPEFDKDTFEYDLGTISSDINELKIIAKLSDENGTIVDSKGLKYTEIIGRDERFKIEKTSFGENNIKIIVTSEDGSTKLEYILTYTKEGGGNPNSSDKDLDALRITGTKNTYNLGFIKDTKEYNITLNYEDEQFYVDADYDQYATAIGEGLYSINPGETKTIIVQVTAGNGDKGDEYKLIITREEADIDNTLFSLKVEYDGNEKNLDLSLNIFQFELIVDTDVTEVNITAKTNSNKATVSGDGLKQLTETINYFPVVVTAEDGSQKTYLIIVKKNSNDALLKELSVQDKETGNELLLIPEFDSETFTYRIDITDITVSTIEIIATANNNSAVVRGTGEFDLKSGTGQTTDRYKVIVTAEDGTEKEYTISIERNIDPDDSIIVEDLKLMGGNTLYLGTSNSAKQKFNMSTTTYDVQVEYELTNIILSVSNLDGAKIIGDGTYDLVDKETKITFTITSKSKEYSKTYIINVIKEEPDSNALLDNILINGDFIENFNPNIFNYTYPVVYEDGLTINIDAITQSNNAVVSGNLNNVPISRGTNTIPIKVTAQDGTEKTYNLIVKAQSDANEILNITVEGANGYLELEFNKSIMTYNLEVEYEISYVVIEATASDGAKIYGVGGKQLQEGRNSYSIYATSEYGGNPGKVYEVIINRKTVDDDTSLKSLVVTTKDGEVLAFNIPFSPYTYEYIINLEDDIDPKIKIEAEANSSLSYVGGIGPKNLEALTDGQVSNVFEITVRAQSGNIGKYTIYVGKNIKLNSEASFKEFKLIGSDEIIYLGLDQSAKTIFDNKDVDIIVPYSVNSVTLYATALYNGTIVGDTGTKNFGTSNEVTFEIGVQSQDGTKTLGTFNITITRENPLTDNTLKEIIINGESLEGFNPEVKKYTIDVDYNSVNGIMITANPTEQTALVTGDIGKQVLETGVNTFTINVVSEDGNINSYIVTVNYLSYNAKLDSLVATDTVSGQTLSFNKEFNSKTKEYNLVVDKSIKEVMIEATEQDETALIISGTGKHEVLPNQITKVEVIVLAADNKTKEIYTINISVAGELSDDTTLSSLKIDGLSLTFDKDLRNYTLIANKNFDKTSIEAIATNQNSKIEFIDLNINAVGNATLNDLEINEGENVLLIKVTAENGESDFYTIKIEKDQTPDYFFLILLIVTFVLWLATILIFIIKNQLNKNKDKEEDNTNIYY